MIKNKQYILSIISFLCLFLLPQIMYAQGNEANESDKMFVVVAVIAVIFVALVITLFVLERKIKNLERLLKK